jgi:class 3 adenylate cyclase
MRRSPEIETLLQRIFPAVDDEVELNTLSSSPDFLSIGTDVGEWWRGRDSWMAAERAHVAEMREQWGSPPSPLVQPTHIEAFEAGEVGWAAVLSEVTAPDQDPVVLRSTFVLILEAGTWRIVQMHHSIGFPSERVLGFELPTGLGELVSSLDDETDATVATVVPAGTATVMFTDIEDSTSWSEKLGDGAWSAAVDDHFSILRRIVESEGGIVVKTMGDGGMFVFPSARAGLLAAVKIQRSLDDSSGSPGFRVRIGLHSGDVLHSEGDYAGLTINKAARVTSTARGGEIVASTVTAELAGKHGFEFGEPMNAALRGLDGVHQVVRLDWLSPDRA